MAAYRWVLGVLVHLGLQPVFLLRQQTHLAVGVRGAAEVTRHQVTCLDHAHGQHAQVGVVGEADVQRTETLLLNTVDGLHRQLLGKIQVQKRGRYRYRKEADRQAVSQVVYA